MSDVDKPKLRHDAQVYHVDEQSENNETITFDDESVHADHKFEVDCEKNDRENDS